MSVEQCKYHASRLIAKTFEEEEIGFRVEQIEEQENICVGFQVSRGPRVFVNFISRDDDNDVAVRILGVVGDVPREKRARLMEACNIINSEVRFLKFVVTNDGDVNVEYDLFERTSDDCIGPVALEALARMSRILDRNYWLLMKAIYTDKPLAPDAYSRMMQLMQEKRTPVVTGDEPANPDDGESAGSISERLEQLNLLFEGLKHMSALLRDCQQAVLNETEDAPEDETAQDGESGPADEDN